MKNSQISRTASIPMFCQLNGNSTVHSTVHSTVGNAAVLLTQRQTGKKGFPVKKVFLPFNVE